MASESKQSSEDASEDVEVARPPRFAPLQIGIKRLIHRYRGARASAAEEAYAANRDAALARAHYACIHCGFVSEADNQISHLDDDHTNNRLENLGCNCELCHPYHHVGEVARPGASLAFSEGHLGPNAMQLFRVPNAKAISVRDMNNLQRAIAIAMADPQTEAQAKEVFNLFSNAVTRNDMQENYASYKAQDFAAGLEMLTEDEYRARGPWITELRLLYNPKQLATWGAKWAKQLGGALSKASNWEKLMGAKLDALAPTPAKPLEDDEPVWPERVVLKQGEDVGIPVTSFQEEILEDEDE